MRIDEIWATYTGVLERKEQLEEQLNHAVVTAANFVSETRATVRNIREGGNYRGHHYRGHVNWELTHDDEIWVDDDGWEISFQPELLWMDGRQLLAWREKELEQARQEIIRREQSVAAQKLAAERAEYERLRLKFGDE